MVSSNVTSADDVVLVLHYNIINWLFILGLSPLNQFFNLELATHKNFKLLKNVVLDYWLCDFILETSVAVFRFSKILYYFS